MRRQTSAPLSAVVVLLLGIAAAGTAQTPPPIPGETGTLALEGTMKTFYGGVNAIIVKSADGVEHLFHFTKRNGGAWRHRADAAFNGSWKEAASPVTTTCTE